MVNIIGSLMWIGMVLVGAGVLIHWLEKGGY